MSTVLQRVKKYFVRIFSEQIICPHNRKSGGSVGAGKIKTKKGLSLNQAKSLYILVGREGFEPSTN